MNKVLIVSPNWPPTNSPELHRTRMGLPFFAEFGWQPLILKTNPNAHEGDKDRELCRSLPQNLRSWEAACLPLWLTRWIGLRNASLRSYFHLARLGDAIIRREKPVVAFFSTTMFPVMTLGRYWHRRHGLPYVLDFQDPWFKGHTEMRKTETLKTDIQIPNLKARLANRLAGILEPFALRRAAHVISVSPAYPRALLDRYKWMRETDFTVLPFGAAESDFEHLRKVQVRQRIFNPKDGERHWVYAGACIPNMALAVRSFFHSLAERLAQMPELRNTLRIHFIGTSYAPRERAVKTVEPLAREAGLGDVVSEVTDRIPYFEALQCLLDADALFVPGSDDPGYTASKIYPYILARKPLLAVFHEQSSVVEVVNKTKAGTIVTFRAGDTSEEVARRVLASGWLGPGQNAERLKSNRTEDGSQGSEVRSPVSGLRPPLPSTDWAAFAPYTAREMTRRLCEVFDRTA